MTYLHLLRESRRVKSLEPGQTPADSQPALATGAAHGLVQHGRQQHRRRTFSLAFLLDLPNVYAENLTQALILALFFGVGTALVQRLLASVVIAVAMAIVSGAFSRQIAFPRAYKFVMALTAAAVVHLFAPVQLVRFYLSELTAGDYDARVGNRRRRCRLCRRDILEPGDGWEVSARDCGSRLKRR